MIQSYLFLTQTYLETGKLQRQIAWQFFVQNRISFDNQAKTSLEKLEENWHKFQNSGQIITVNFDSKKDAREQIMGFYQSYPEPILFFLGDLQEYSIPLQEGLLKFLEEPPANLFIILFSHNSSQILPTILSRCQKVLVPTELVFEFLDPNISEIIKEKLPPPGKTCADFLKGSQAALPDLKKIERNELDLWLWQVEKCLEGLWKREIATDNSKILSKIANLINKTLTARQLNNQNLQKKFVLAYLWLKD